MLRLLGIFATSLALESVTISGNAFYNGTDSRFYIRGIDYQPGGSSNLTDPLSDESLCKRDIPYFKELGVNTVRIYTADNSQDHTTCMNLLADAGIYVLLDVNTPHQSLNRMNEDSLKASYNAGYLQHIFATVDSFMAYSNTLGFLAANEVINDDKSTIAAPYIKAVVRDLKNYIKNHANRTIPVGYAAADIVQNRWQQMEYLNCGDNETERIDMFGMNDYSFCDSSFEQSGWSQNVQEYGDYSVPVFLSEYGCNKHLPRKFPEVESLYSDKMSSVYSGGLVYEYSEEENHYGLVRVNGDSVDVKEDFNNLKSQLAANPDPTGSAGAETTRQPASCPTYEKGKWDVQNDNPPSMPTDAEYILKHGAGWGLGFDAPDTQSGNPLSDEQLAPGNTTSSSSSSSSSTATGNKSSSTSLSTSSITSGDTTSSAISQSSTGSSNSSDGAQVTTIALSVIAAALLQFL